MLSFDIQVEILKRLPVRLLIQFRSVCKAWKSLIDSPHFIAGYDARHDQSDHHLIVREEIGDSEEVESEIKRFSFVDDDTFPQQKFALTVPRLVEVTTTTFGFGSSHGLLCSTGFLGGPDPTTVIATLWNPAIRKSIAVVVPDRRPGEFNTIVGFGVRPDTKDPKLVKIAYIADPMKIESISCIPRQVMVFTLSSGEWTCLCSDRLLPRKSIRFFNHGAQTVIGRFIYLVAYDWIGVGDHFWHRYLVMLLSFDLITNEFREVHLPSSLATYRGRNFSISSLRESLVVVEYDDIMVEPVPVGTDNNWKQVCTVWMMEHGDSKAFTKLFTINLPNASVCSFLGFRKNGEAIVIVDDDYPDVHRQCIIVAYEPCSENIKELGIRGERYALEVSSLSGCFYTESLLLLDHDEGHIVRCGPVKR